MCFIYVFDFPIVEFSSFTQSCPTLCDPWTAACEASLFKTNPGPYQTYVHRVGVAIQQSHPLLFPSPPAFSLFQHQGLFQWVSSSHQVAKVLVYSGLISFRIDWFDLLAGQGTLKSLLQHYSSKAPIFLHSAFFIVQFSHPYTTTGKIIALTRQTLLAK